MSLHVESLISILAPIYTTTQKMLGYKNPQFSPLSNFSIPTIITILQQQLQETSFLLSPLSLSLFFSPSFLNIRCCS
ncbi:hypothetical protein RIF29_12029 [Crotalaria pallida]|uniref:Uncharacterized protein n=1 Tax=Crotalaria pallida TaxID=3830 RepID=A0AAN9IMT4_CROPI